MSGVALLCTMLFFEMPPRVFSTATKAFSTPSFVRSVLLAAAYMYTRSLWFVMGLHFAWNFTEGGIFSTSVSGGRAEGMIGVQFTGSDALTGGAFGPEASLPAVLVCLAAGVAFIILSVRADRIAFAQEQIPELRLADAGGAFEHGLEHWLQCAG